LEHNEKDIKKWKKKRQKGRLSYTLTICFLVEVGVFGWLLTRYMLSNSAIFSWSNIGYVMGGVLGGVIGSILRWNKNEHEYADFIHNK
jgi:hypothetical protein